MKLAKDMRLILTDCNFVTRAENIHIVDATEFEKSYLSCAIEVRPVRPAFTLNTFTRKKCPYSEIV